MVRVIFVCISERTFFITTSMQLSTSNNHSHHGLPHAELITITKFQTLSEAYFSSSLNTLLGLPLFRLGRFTELLSLTLSFSPFCEDGQQPTATRPLFPPWLDGMFHPFFLPDISSRFPFNQTRNISSSSFQSIFISLPSENHHCQKSQWPIHPSTLFTTSWPSTSFFSHLTNITTFSTWRVLHETLTPFLPLIDTLSISPLHCELTFPHSFVEYKIDSFVFKILLFVFYLLQFWHLILHFPFVWCVLFLDGDPKLLFVIHMHLT